MKMYLLLILTIKFLKCKQDNNNFINKDKSSLK